MYSDTRWIIWPVGSIVWQLIGKPMYGTIGRLLHQADGWLTGWLVGLLVVLLDEYIELCRVYLCDTALHKYFVSFVGFSSSAFINKVSNEKEVTIRKCI